jgi:amino acid transporter
MHALAVSSLVFALVFAGSLVGMVIRRAAPETHFAPEAKDTIRLAIGLVVTMTGLVLGMLVSSAKTFYDGEKSQVAEMATQIILMNDLLLGYGPETKLARVEALGFVEDAADRIWPKDRSALFQLRPEHHSEDFYREVQLLVPKNDAQASAKAQLVSLTMNLKRSYWLMYLQTVQTPVPTPLVIVVTSWLVAIFISFGIFAPRNLTVMATLIVCAMAVSAAIFIITSMYSPFTGVLKISPDAIRDAVQQIGKQP